VGRRCVLEIQDGSQLTGSSNISETMTYTIDIPTTNLRHSTTANSQEVYLGDSNNERQSKTATETGNTYISETVKSTVKIPTTNLGYKTTHRWKIVSASKYNSDRQPEISIWQPKPEIITLVELWQITSKFQRHIRIFDDVQLHRRLTKWLRLWSTTRNYAIGEQNVYIAVSGCRSLSQSPGISFFALSVVENPICRWNCHPICHSSSYISISGLGGHIPFPVVGHCRNHLATLYSGSSWSKIPDLPLEFRRYLL